MKPIKVRFAPSPTGHLHIGGARTALFNYLYAKKNNGIFLVRIEDTDLVRSSEESEKVIINDLKWLGIDWDEGIEKGGDCEPYRSTERKEIYNKFIDSLIESGKAYYCFCSAEELEKEKKEAEEKGEMYFYSGKCSSLSKEQVEKFLAEGKKQSVRLKEREGKKISVDDQVKGRVEFDSENVGDFIIVKSDGIPVYNLAVVIDDHLMEITHVIRAEEHLSNTPRQILIYEALGFDVPKFAHVSLILGKDRTKMSKRHGSTWVEQYRDKGYLPEAVVNFLALMGWSPEGEQEFFSIEELCQKFSLDRVSKNPAVFDNDKLDWMNQQYIKNANIDLITKLSLPYLQAKGYASKEINDNEYEWFKIAVNTVREGVQYLEQIPEHLEIFFKDDVKPTDEEGIEIISTEDSKIVFKSFYEKVKEAESFDMDFCKTIFKAVQKETKIKGKNLYMPVRIVLTGVMHGPDINSIVYLIGKEKVLRRLSNAINND